MEIWRIFSPVLLHAVLSGTAAILAAGRLDAAELTLLASLLVLPFGGWMYAKDRKEKKKNRNVFAGILCVLAGGGANLLWSGILSLLRIQELFSNEAQEALLAAGLPVQILALGLAAPLAEELIFRGLVYQRMRNLLPEGWSVVLSALLFSLYHGNVIQAVFAFPMALILGALMEKKQNLLFPVLFHIGANFAAVLTEFL